jgi:hypothetical protein
LDHQLFGTGTDDNSINSSSSLSSPLDLSTINVSSGVARSYLDQLIVEGKKDDGRIERWNRQQQHASQRNDAIKKLKGLTNLTSTQLAAAEDYHLRPETRDSIKKHLESKESKQKKIVMRKIDRRELMIQKYLPAREKTISNPSDPLSGEELKSLLQYHKRKNDSPIKNRIADRRLQWEQRRQRMMEDPYPSVLL